MKGFTVIHNYYLKRPDGTTAAERFFATEPFAVDVKQVVAFFKKTIC